MKKIVQIFITCGIICITESREKNNNFSENKSLQSFMNFVINESIHEIKPYQIVYFFNECLENSTILNAVLEHSMKQVPVITFDLSQDESISFDERILRKPLTYKPRFITLFISILFLESQDKVSENMLITKFKKVIRFITKISPISVRPHCLILINSKFNVDERIIHFLLNFGWENKFLDLTIIEIPDLNVKNTTSSLIYNYNPFKSQLDKKWYSEKLKIFPNKIKDMNGFEMKIAIVNKPPYIIIEKDALGNVVHGNGTEFETLLILSQALNFTITFFSPNVLVHGEVLVKNSSANLLDMIVNGEIDMSGNQMYTHVVLNKGETGMSLNFDGLCALVPVLKVPVSKWPFKSLIPILNISLTVIFFRLVTLLLKFDKLQWQAHNIFQLILGLTITKKPKKFTERILFGILIILSFWITINLHAELMNVRIQGEKEISLDTFEDLEKSGLNIEIYTYDFDITFSYNKDSDLQKLKKKTKLVIDILECPFRTLKTKDTACLLNLFRARELINVRKKSSGKSDLKIMKQMFWSAGKGYIFSQASPYVEEINSVLLKLTEMGLTNKGNYEPEIYAANKFIREEEPTEYSGKNLHLKFIYILVFGYTLSVITFAMELLLYFLHIKNINFRLFMKKF